MMRRAHLTALLLVALPAAAQADSCAIEKSVYGDPDQAYELRFAAIDQAGPEGNLQHVFKLAVKGTELVLDGQISIPREVSRTEGVITYQCPEGAEGDALAACTIWEGTMFGADDQGNIDLLPLEGGDHPLQIILPGLGRAIRMSAVWGDKKAAVAPWDVFRFEACGK
jgi:hypothetical protein